MIENIFAKRELKGSESDIYISNDSWIIMDIQWWIHKYELIGVV